MKISALLFVFVASFGALRAAESTPAAAAPTTCVVSGEKLGEMGQPYTFKAADGTEVQLCCKGCKAQFDKDPDKFLSKLHGQTCTSPVTH